MTKTDHINSIPLYDDLGKEAGKFDLDKEVFSGKVNFALMHQAVLMYQANKRRGTASTKVRDEVSGGGIKPWKQKGTGRARAGDIRSPLWRKGGVVFGPKPHDFGYSLPKGLRKNALISGMNAKIKSGGVLAIESIKLEEPKTKTFKALLDKLKLQGRTLFIDRDPSRPVRLSCRNIRLLTLKDVREFTVLDIFTNDHILFTKKALEALSERLKGK